MKTMTYAQQADIAAKCKRVFESVTRGNQLKAAESYADLANKALASAPDLSSQVNERWIAASQRIKNKPRYRFNHSFGVWLRDKKKDPVEFSIDLRHNELARIQSDAMRAAMNRQSINHTLAQGHLGAFGQPLNVNPITGW